MAEGSVAAASPGDMDAEEYKRAQGFWQRHDASDEAKRMPAERVRAWLDEFLAGHDTCALATGYGTEVRCTPLEYTWFEGELCVISEGGLKFVGLEHNKRVSVAVFEKYAGFGGLASAQIDGHAIVQDEVDDRFRRLLAHKKIPEAALARLDHPMYLVRLVPEHATVLCSAFKKDGFDSRQSCDLAPVD